MGILTNTEILLSEVTRGKRVLRSILRPLDIREASDMLEWLWQSRLTMIYVQPGSVLSRTLSCSWLQEADPHWNVVIRAAPQDPTRPTNALLWPRGSGREARHLTLAFPEQSGWNWQVADATSLLATVTYLQQALERPFIDPPDLAARQILTAFTREQPFSLFRSSLMDLHTLSDGKGKPISLIEQDSHFAWKRPLTLAEQRQNYLHKYRHLSLNLEACLGVPLGTGGFQSSPNGRAFDGVRPGIWHVKAERAGSVFDGKMLPSCLDGEWMSTPQVKCCRDIGYQVVVLEGFYWSEFRSLLSGWANFLWQAGERVQTHPLVYRHTQARSNTLQTIATLARLGVEQLALPETAGGWARPDWEMQVIGHRQARRFAHLVRLVRKGTMPVLIDEDALWVVFNDPNPLTAVPGLLTAPRWRGYIADYPVPLPLTSEIKQAFRTVDQASQLTLMLDTLACEITS